MGALVAGRDLCKYFEFLTILINIVVRILKACFAHDL